MEKGYIINNKRPILRENMPYSVVTYIDRIADKLIDSEGNEKIPDYNWMSELS